MVSYTKWNRGGNRLKKTGAWLLCAIWMGVIFVMSAMPGDTSSQQSGRIVQLLMKLIALLFGEGAAQGLDMQRVSFLVRKLAHMTEYAILFILYRHALALSGARRPGLTALVMSAAYACTDEIHQGFVDDRMPSAVDVMIDTAGACAAWGMCGALKYLFRKRKTVLRG